MGVPTALGLVSVPGAREGDADVEVREYQIEDRVRVELRPDTHITLGYFDPQFVGHYAQMVLAMLEGGEAPR